MRPASTFSIIQLSNSRDEVLPGDVIQIHCDGSKLTAGIKRD